MQRKKAQLFWDILSHLDLSRCVCGECYDYHQKCHNSLPHCVIVWVLWCEDSSASAVRYSEYYPPPAHNYFSLHFLSDILQLWIFNVPKVELTFFLIILPQFDIFNCQYAPLCYGLQKKNPKPNWIKSSWFLGKVILRACLFFCHKPTVPLKPSPHKQVPPIQTYIIQMEIKNISIEIPKYFNRNTKIL